MQVVDQQIAKDYLSSFSREVQELVLKARALIFSVMPESLELLDPSIHMIAYGSIQIHKGRFAAQ